MIHDEACTATDRGLVLRQHCNCGLDSDSQINHDQPDVANGVYVELGRGMQTFYCMSLQWNLVFFDVFVSSFGVEEMLQSRVQPSNITFSILVKLHFEAQRSDYSMWNMAAVYPSPIVARVEGEGCSRLFETVAPPTQMKH